MTVEISPADAANTGSTLVDVRARVEWDEGHVAGAIHIPLGELSARAAELADGPVVFYCRTGERSSMAAEAFAASGREATSLAGGLEAWEAAGQPLEA